jgi:hypothetical protein
MTSSKHFIEALGTPPPSATCLPLPRRAALSVHTIRVTPQSHEPVPYVRCLELCVYPRATGALREGSRVLGELTIISADDVSGGVDAMKLRWSVPLVPHADPDTGFRRAVDIYLGGVPDAATEARLGRRGDARAG